jgi:hypothetical protein
MWTLPATMIITSFLESSTETEFSMLILRMDMFQMLEQFLYLPVTKAAAVHLLTPMEFLGRMYQFFAFAYHNFQLCSETGAPTAKYTQVMVTHQLHSNMQLVQTLQYQSS